MLFTNFFWTLCASTAWVDLIPTDFLKRKVDMWPWWNGVQKSIWHLYIGNVLCKITYCVCHLSSQCLVVIHVTYYSPTFFGHNLGRPNTRWFFQKKGGHVTLVKWSTKLIGHMYVRNMLCFPRDFKKTWSVTRKWLKRVLKNYLPNIVKISGKHS